MGIVNFSTYVEHALKWPTPLYDCNRQRRVNLHYADDDALAMDERDDATVVSDLHPSPGLIARIARRRYLNEVLASARSRLGTPGIKVPCRSKNNTLYGVSIDLSSFAYGTIVEATTRNCRWSKEGEHDGLCKRKNDAFDESCLQETSSTTESFDSQTFDIRLDEKDIENCTESCLKRMADVIGHEALNNSRYLTIHFDQNTTSCKSYLQYKRRNASVLRVDIHSVYRVYRRLVRRTGEIMRETLIKDFPDHLKTITEEDEQNETGGVTVESVVKSLADDGDNAFYKRTVADKMRLSHDNESVTLQRYTIGEGEWKCFYDIRDAECEAMDGNDGERHHWYVFGNDSDIGLGALLYSSARTRIHYVNNSSTIFSPPDHVCVRQDLNAYKALHFLSLCLMGNDYVLRMVNDNTRNILALGNEVAAMLASDEYHCKTSVNRMADVFEVSGGATSSHERNDEDALDGVAAERSAFARSFSYLIGRLLVAVYKDPADKTADSVEKAFWDASATTPAGPRCDVISLRCDDGKHRTLKTCLKVFATRALWYLSYCTFYRHYTREQRAEFRTEPRRNFALSVPKLPIERCFAYNESRLVDGEHFEISNLTEVRVAIKNRPTIVLIRLLESTVMDVLEK